MRPNPILPDLPAFLLKMIVSLTCAMCAVGCAPQTATSGTAPAVARPAVTPHRSPQNPKKSPPAHCSFHVNAPERAPFVVEVRARCDGRETTGFVSDVSELEAFVTREKPKTRTPDSFELVYRVDLDAMARKFDSFDLAARFGGSLVAGASSFLFTPVPATDGVPVTVTFGEPNGFATGLRRGSSGYTIESHELRVATYTTFGAREVRRLEAPGATLRMALLDGKLALGADRMARWVETGFRAVTTFYEQAPDREVLVVIAPVPNEQGVKFGRLLPESAPGIVMLVGENTTERDLLDDWMLVHELFHVGTPSYGAKSGWFDEGLATYFEPLIRARAGLYEEKKLWREFASEMPRGLEAFTHIGLASGKSRDDIYWGGGLFCLLADVEARKRTNGERGLEDGLRAVLREGGNSSEVWGLEETFAAIDRGIGAPVLAELAERHVAKGTPVDLPRLFLELGVAGAPKGGLRLDEKAPLAAVRRALVSGRAR